MLSIFTLTIVCPSGTSVLPRHGSSHHLSKGSLCHHMPGLEALFTNSTNARTLGESSRLLGKTTLTSTDGIFQSGNRRTRRPASTSAAHTYAERPPTPAPLRTIR